MSFLGGIGSGSFKINIGKVLSEGVNQAKSILKNAAGDFLKSGFEAAKKTVFSELGKLLGIQQPPASIAAKSPSMPGNTGVVGQSVSGAGSTGGSAASSSLQDAFKSVASPNSDNPKAFIEHELGPDATKDWDKIPPAEQNALKRQAAMQRATRATQTMTSILQMLHEMNKSIIQNFRA